MLKSLISCLIVLLCFISMMTFHAGAEEKKSYLFLTVTNIQKELFLPLTNGGNIKNVKIISLQELKKINKKEEVREALREIWRGFPFDFCGFYWKVVPGTVERVVDGITYTVNSNDAFYWNLDADLDYKPEFFCGRITDQFLKTVWENSFSLNATIGMSFFSYPCTTYCPGSDCILEAKDLSVVGESTRTIFSANNINSITMYETRSSIQPKYKPDMSLTKDNFSLTYANCSLGIFISTSEPRNAFKAWTPSIHDSFVTSIWTDTDKNNKVDNYNAEIQTEEIWNGHSVDNKKRLIITESAFKPDAYALINFQFGTMAYDVNYYMSVMKAIINGVSFGQAVCSVVYGYIQNKPEFSGTGMAVRMLANISFFGLPDTVLDDLIEQARVQITPDTTNGIEIAMSETKCVLTIQNIGRIETSFSFIDNEFLDINPSEGIISVGAKTEIQISIKRRSVGDLISCSLPKKKKTILTLRFSKETAKIIVSWYGVWAQAPKGRNNKLSWVLVFIFILCYT